MQETFSLTVSDPWIFIEKRSSDTKIFAYIKANKGFPHKLAVICARITQHPKQPALLLVHKALDTLTRAESLSCSLWAPHNLSLWRTPSETRAGPEDWMVLCVSRSGAQWLRAAGQSCTFLHSFFLVSCSQSNGSGIMAPQGQNVISFLCISAKRDKYSRRNL